MFSRRLAGPTAGHMAHTDMDQSLQERTGRDNDRLRVDGLPGIRHHPADCVAFRQQAIGRTRHDFKVGLVRQCLLHGLAIQGLVALDARGPYRRPFPRVQHAKLNARFIRVAADLPTQRIDFLDQVPLADPAHRGITRHVRDPVLINGQQQHPAPHPGPSQHSFTSSMPAADNDDVTLN